MAEREINWPYQAGYNFDAEDAKLGLYRLLNQYLAQEKIADLASSDDWLFNAIDIVGHHFDVETQKTLIHAATVARVTDDSETDSRLKLSNFKTSCGTLVEDIDNDSKPKDLDLREACNKILHATKYHYDTDQIPMERINPTVYLYGRKGKKNWKATLDIVDFSKYYINNIT